MSTYIQYVMENEWMGVISSGVGDRTEHGQWQRDGDHPDTGGCPQVGSKINR